MIIINTTFDTGLINKLTGYYDRAKKRAEMNKNAFQNIKENIKNEKTENENSVSDNSSKTLDEFKKEIYDIINSVPITGLANSQIVINISDEAFKKMMNDSEFMKVQLGALIRDLGWPPTQMYNPAYVIFEIDSEYGYRGTSYGSNYKNIFETKSENSFWEKRKKKFKEHMEKQQEYNYNEKLKMKYLEMKKMNSKAIARKMAINKGYNISTEYEESIYMPYFHLASELLNSL